MINLDFDVNKIFQERLASSIGLDKYQLIMSEVHKTDVSKDLQFQKTFNGFYIVRRNAAWRKIYYDYFEKAKTKTPTFEDIITYLYEQTGNIEPSFSSKMLATIFPDKPIWDRYVVQNLGIDLDGKSKEERLSKSIALYQDIELWYKDFLTTSKAKECIAEFNRMLPDYAAITDIKKIDSILWSIR